MKKTIQITKDLSSKKVAVFKDTPTSSNPEPLVVAWLKPGDKLKTEDKTEYRYGGILGDKKYMQVFYNGQSGWILSNAVSLNKEVS